MSKPVVALSMRPQVAEHLFADEWDRLEQVAALVSREPFTALAGEAALAEVDVLLTGWGVPGVDEAVLAAAPKLRAIVHAAGTVKGFVGQACWDRGILVTSVAAANALPVAEFTVAAITLANKGAFLAANRQAPNYEVGNRGKRIGLIGASKVGRLTIELLRPYDNEVVVADPLLTEEEAADLGVQLVELDDLLATCDVVSLHAPLLPETVNMIDRRRLGLLKDGAVFINTARGAIVDGIALEDELATGRISAVIDTTDPEPLPESSRLPHLPNVFLTPHIAGSMGTELARLASTAIDELERFARGEPFAFGIAESDLPWIA
jgi:phosphoglycerate dehydrogenase-like enzyme